MTSCPATGKPSTTPSSSADAIAVWTPTTGRNTTGAQTNAGTPTATTAHAGCTGMPNGAFGEEVTVKVFVLVSNTGILGVYWDRDDCELAVTEYGPYLAAHNLQAQIQEWSVA